MTGFQIRQTNGTSQVYRFNKATLGDQEGTDWTFHVRNGNGDDLKSAHIYSAVAGVSFLEIRFVTAPPGGLFLIYIDAPAEIDPEGMLSAPGELNYENINDIVSRIYVYLINLQDQIDRSLHFPDYDSVNSGELGNVEERRNAIQAYDAEGRPSFIDAASIAGSIEVGGGTVVEGNPAPASGQAILFTIGIGGEIFRIPVSVGPKGDRGEIGPQGPPGRAAPASEIPLTQENVYNENVKIIQGGDGISLVNDNTANTITVNRDSILIQDLPEGIEPTFSQDATPQTAPNGSFWFRTSDFRWFIRYQNFWVETRSGGGGGGSGASINQVYSFNKQILQEGTGITITADDSSNELTITAEFDDSEVYPAVKDIITAGTGITITPDDTNETLSIVRDSITAADIPNLDASKIAFGTLAADILSTAGEDGDILVKEGSAQVWKSPTIGTTTRTEVYDFMDAILAGGSGITVTRFDDVERISISQAVLTAADIPNIGASKITGGIFTPARLASGGREGQVLTRTSGGQSWETPQAASAVVYPVQDLTSVGGNRNTIWPLDKDNIATIRANNVNSILRATGGEVGGLYYLNVSAGAGTEPVSLRLIEGFNTGDVYVDPGSNTIAVFLCTAISGAFPFTSTMKLVSVSKEFPAAGVDKGKIATADGNHGVEWLTPTQAPVLVEQTLTVEVNDAGTHAMATWELDRGKIATLTGHPTLPQSIHANGGEDGGIYYLRYRASREITTFLSGFADRKYFVRTGGDNVYTFIKTSGLGLRPIAQDTSILMDGGANATNVPELGDVLTIAGGQNPNNIRWSKVSAFVPSNAGTTSQILTKTATGYEWDDSAAVTAFNPENTGTTSQILTKTATGYEWDAAPTSIMQLANNASFGRFGRVSGRWAQSDAVSLPNDYMSKLFVFSTGSTTTFIAGSALGSAIASSSIHDTSTSINRPSYTFPAGGSTAGLRVISFTFRGSTSFDLIFGSTDVASHNYLTSNRFNLWQLN